MDKKYIEDQYHLAVLDYKIARNEDEQWEARKTMASSISPRLTS